MNIKFTIDGDAYGAATMKIKCAESILLALGVLMGDVEDEPISVSRPLMNEALMGIGYLLKNAADDLHRGRVKKATS